MVSVNTKKKGVAPSFGTIFTVLLAIGVLIGVGTLGKSIYIIIMLRHAPGDTFCISMSNDVRTLHSACV